MRNACRAGVGLLTMVAFLSVLLTDAAGFPVSSYARTDKQWEKSCREVKTSYNPKGPLSNKELTINPNDERWLDFIYWVFNNKMTEHQVEAFGGTLWQGPKTGVIFHWAPGSYWEKHTVASFGFTIGHVTAEHGWRDTMFPDFFAKYGGTYGALVKDRLYEISPKDPTPWVEFLTYAGGPQSPYYRYLFHQEAYIDPDRQRIVIIGGQGAAFEYTYERYLEEAAMVLTDCKAYEFFRMYDKFGRGFASKGGWAGNPLVGKSSGLYVSREKKEAAKGTSEPKGPSRPSRQVSKALVPAKKIYDRECAPCHGLDGDGNGLLAYAMDPRPRDFTKGEYKFRKTPSGSIPTDDDLYEIVSRGIVSTSMPGWSQFLSEKDRREVVKYTKTFSERFVAERPGPAIGVTRPIPLTSASIARGERLYRDLKCWECHGDTGKGDGPSAPTLKDDWGFPIIATDLTYKWNYKAGYSPEEIYRAFMTGLSGTPMPSYADSIAAEEDRWHLINYVLSLSPKERPKITVRP